MFLKCVSKSKNGAAILALIFLLCSSAGARLHVSLHAISEYTPATPLLKDEFVTVPGSEVAYANFFALRRDFKILQKKSDEEIKEWILRNFARISRSQFLLNHIRHTVIPSNSGNAVQNEVVEGYRPENYDRAALFEPSTDKENPLLDGRPGVVDIKGIGAPPGHQKITENIERFEKAQGDQSALKELRDWDHSNFLMSLTEAIAELTRQMGLQKIADILNVKEGKSLQTAETYFIIKFPFQIMNGDGSTDAAALYGREATVGRDYTGDFPRGIYRTILDWPQSDLLGAAVDFGAVIFDDNRVRNTLGPDPWDYSNNPQATRAWKYAGDVARAFERPVNPDKEVIYRHLKEVVMDPLEQEWNSIQPRLWPLYASSPRDADYLLKTLRDSLAVDGRRKGSRVWAVLRILHIYRAPGVEKVFSEAFKSSYNEIRAMAAEALQGYNGPRAASLFREALNDPEAGVRMKAALSLKTFRGPESHELFLKILDDENIQVLSFALSALVAQEEKDVTSILRSYNGRNRKVIMDFLIQTGRQRDAELLREPPLEGNSPTGSRCQTMLTF